MSLEELKVISKFLLHVYGNCSALFSHMSDVAHLIKCLSSNASNIDLIGRQNELSDEETMVCPVQERFPSGL